MENKEYTILVIDDQDDVLQAIQDILQAENYKVLTAENGKRGLEKAVKYTPDIVITDVIMPDMEGTEFIKSLKRIKKDIPIIVMSGNPVGIQFFKAAGLFGAQVSLTKPFTRMDLLNVISNIIASK